MNDNMLLCQASCMTDNMLVCQASCMADGMLPCLAGLQGSCHAPAQQLQVKELTGLNCSPDQ